LPKMVMMHRALLALLTTVSPGAAWVARGGFSSSSFARNHRVAASSARGIVRMGAVPPGGKVLCVGNGPVLLLAAKRAALEGYATTVVAGSSYETYMDLLYEGGDYSKPVENLVLLESITGPNEQMFDDLLATCDGLLVAIDGDEAISEGLLDVVLPAGVSTCKRIVAMSRNLNGKGLGPFVAASKTAGNREVWAGGKDAVASYRTMEAKLAALCAATSADQAMDCVVVRAGTLKGGGPGADDTPETKRLGLAYSFYGMGQQDLVNWRLLFDAQAQGVVLTPGDSAEGPGLSGVFAATATAGGTKGDSGRLGVAGAMVKALDLALGPEGGGGGGGGGSRRSPVFDFGVGTAESRTPPTDIEWELEFAKLRA